MLNINDLGDKNNIKIEIGNKNNEEKNSTIKGTLSPTKLSTMNWNSLNP